MLKQNGTAIEFFNAMLKRWPDRRMGATTLWAGASALYARCGDVVQDSLAGWFATT